MADMHLFGNIRGGKVNYYFLLWYFREFQVIYHLVNSLLYKRVFHFYLEETFLVGLNWLYDFVDEEIIDNFIWKLKDSFAAKRSTLFFIFVHVELFHCSWRDILKLVFEAILYEYVTFESWKSLYNNLPQSLFH